MATDALLLGSSLRAVELFLRLPPLYLMDAILTRQMAPFEGTTLIYSDGTRISLREMPEANFNIGSEESSEELYKKAFGDGSWVVVCPHLLRVMLGVTTYVAAAFVVTLGLRQLLALYLYLAAVLCIPLSLMSHNILGETLERGSEAEEAFIHKYLATELLPSVRNFSLWTRAVMANYIVQMCLGLVFSFILRPHFGNKEFVTWAVTLSMLSPNLLALIGTPSDVYGLSSALSLLLPIIILTWVLYVVMGTAARSVASSLRAKREFVANFGLNTFVEAEWTRLRVPSLLRTFWITRVGLHLFTELASTSFVVDQLSTISAEELWQSGLSLCRQLVTRGAETIIAVLGMSSIVSSICHYVGGFFHLLICTGEEEEKSVASASGVLFFVLALQTGVTSLEPDKRFACLCKNVCLLVTALFHFVHNIVHPVLESLSAEPYHHGRSRRARALLVCAFLVAAPVSLMIYVWKSFYVGTWMLAVTAFCIVVVVKVTVSVSVYALHMYDQLCQEGTWELLDDTVYYIKAAGNTVEFAFAILLFFNGGWILIYESGGTIRAVMMLIHAYCNIWVEAKSGWQTFIKRRTAAEKINSLLDASSDLLGSHDDVCAICQQEMATAKVTICRHIFHSVCLRKWLYVQDTCPLCHAVLYHSSAKDTGESNNNSSQVRRRRQESLNNNQIVGGGEVGEEEEEVIDNSFADESSDDGGDTEENTSREVVVSMEGVEADSSSEVPSDNDLIYDSMEDFGSSGDEVVGAVDS